MISLEQGTDTSALKQQRHNILTEIVNLASGRDDDEEEKLKISRLVRAKSICEDRLQELGDPGFKLSNDDSSSSSGGGGGSFKACRKTLSFGAIMNSPFSRRYFYTFLEQQHMADLLGFWVSASLRSMCIAQ